MESFFATLADPAFETRVKETQIEFSLPFFYSPNSLMSTPTVLASLMCKNEPNINHIHKKIMTEIEPITYDSHI